MNEQKLLDKVFHAEPVTAKQLFDELRVKFIELEKQKNHIIQMSKGMDRKKLEIIESLFEQMLLRERAVARREQALEFRESAYEDAKTKYAELMARHNRLKKEVAHLRSVCGSIDAVELEDSGDEADVESVGGSSVTAYAIEEHHDRPNAVDVMNRGHSSPEPQATAMDTSPKILPAQNAALLARGAKQGSIFPPTIRTTSRKSGLCGYASSESSDVDMPQTAIRESFSTPVPDTPTRSGMIDIWYQPAITLGAHAESTALRAQNTPGGSHLNEISAAGSPMAGVRRNTPYTPYHKSDISHKSLHEAMRKWEAEKPSQGTVVLPNAPPNSPAKSTRDMSVPSRTRPKTPSTATDIELNVASNTATSVSSERKASSTQLSLAHDSLTVTPLLAFSSTKNTNTRVDVPVASAGPTVPPQDRAPSRPAATATEEDFDIGPRSYEAKPKRSDGEE